MRSGRAIQQRYAGRRQKARPDPIVPRYSELLKGGVKIYERRGALLHVKTAIVDGVWSCVGSSNLDWRSALDNDEINAVILGREFSQQMQAAFARDMAASDAIELASWERRSRLLRLKEWTARLWGRLL